MLGEAAAVAMRVDIGPSFQLPVYHELLNSLACSGLEIPVKSPKTVGFLDNLLQFGLFRMIDRRTNFLLRCLNPWISGEFILAIS